MLSTNCFVIAENLGLPCIPTFKKVKKWIFVPLFNNAGVLNEIDLTAGPFNAAFFTALVNKTDPSERWYPTAEVKNVEDNRVDASFEESDDGDKFFVQENVRTVAGLFFASNAPAQMVAKLNSLRGGSWGVYGVDTEFNLIGKQGSTANKFAPVAVNGDSFYAMFIPAQAKAVQKIKFMFDISTAESDGDLRMIKATELAYNLSELRALINITSEIVAGSITTTGFKIKLMTEGGTPLNPILDEGLTVPEFVSSDDGATSRIYNETDDANVTILTADESPDGVYEITFAAQTVADVLVPFAKKDGRDYTALKTVKVTIP